MLRFNFRLRECDLKVEHAGLETLSTGAPEIVSLALMSFLLWMGNVVARGIFEYS